MNKTVLVTGGNGYLALHIIYQLLQQDYQVRTTVRSLKSADHIKETLRANGITDLSKLTFVEADLLKDEGWDQAVENQEYVLNVAYPSEVSFEDRNEINPPVVQGVRRVLTAASRAGVKRIILTSSFNTIASRSLDKCKVFTEQDWAEENQPGLSYYDKFKLLAEKAAWEFIENDPSGMELVTVNPVAILGPPLDGYKSGSFSMLKMVFIKGFPDLPLNIVDVRDLADIHIRAMITPEAKNQRFIAATGKITMWKLEKLLRKERPEMAAQLAAREITQRVLDVAAVFKDPAKLEILLPNLNHTISNQKAKDILAWRPLFTKEQTVLDSIDGMVRDVAL